jgi:hypothetical protein
MIVFVVLAPNDSPLLSNAITSSFPTDFLKLGPGQWLVAGKGTAVDVSKTLGVTDGKTGPAVIFSIASYFGASDPNVWEWLRVKLSVA